MPEDGWMAIASCKPNYRSSPFWWIDFVELWPTKTSSEMALWNVPAIDRWTSEVIQHIQQIFVGVVFLGPSKKDSKKEPRFDQDLNIWCDYRGQPWSNFIPWISWRGRVSFVVFSSKNNSPATKRTTISNYKIYIIYNIYCIYIYILSCFWDCCFVYFLWAELLLFITGPMGEEANRKPTVGNMCSTQNFTK